MNLKTTVLSIAVHHENDNPLFGESSTHVCIEDEAGGPFIILRQSNEDNSAGEVYFNIEELELVAKVARKLINQFPEED